MLTGEASTDAVEVRVAGHDVARNPDAVRAVIGVTGQLTAWTIWAACSRAPSRVTCPSGRPRVAANPLLVVARAWKPSQASSTADPRSQGWAGPAADPLVQSQKAAGLLDVVGHPVASIHQQAKDAGEASTAGRARRSPAPLRLFGGHLRLTTQRGDEHLELWYQTTPRALAASSRYTEVLRHHGFTSPSGLRPDMVLRRASSDRERWLLVEVKLYGQVQDGARAALQNLLAYRRAFDTGLANTSGVYGLGIAWGTDLHPAPTEVMLCTPDAIPTAIRQFAD